MDYHYDSVAKRSQFFRLWIVFQRSFDQLTNFSGRF